MYQIQLHNGRVVDIKQTDPEVIKRLAAKLELIPVTLANGNIEYMSKGSVANIGVKSKTTFKEAETKQLPPVDTHIAEMSSHAKSIYEPEEYAKSRNKIAEIRKQIKERKNNGDSDN